MIEGHKTLVHNAPNSNSEEVGFGALRAVGDRPLLTLLMDYSDLEFTAHHTAAYYDELLFATSRGRLVGSAAGRGSVFDEISDGQFRFVNAGVLGPFRHPDDPKTTVDESTYECAYGSAPGCTAGALQRDKAIQAAAASGFDFRRYDTDGDGCVRTEELTILMLFAERGGLRTGASTDGPTRVLRLSPSLLVCSRTVGAGESSSAATLSHELLHTLGLVDAYGGSGNNWRYSLMGARPSPTRRTTDSSCTSIRTTSSGSAGCDRRY